MPLGPFFKIEKNISWLCNLERPKYELFVDDCFNTIQACMCTQENENIYGLLLLVYDPSTLKMIFFVLR
jgi:hypothetical protein